MSKQQILERERRWARPVALAALASVLLFVIAAVVGAGSEVNDADTDAQFLTAFEQESGTQLVTALLQAAGLALISVPLFYLFQAAAARSDRMRSALIGVTVAAPLFLAAAWITRWIAFDNAAGEFATPGGGLGIPVGEYAEDLVEDQAAFGATQGLNFAGTLGLIFAVAYTALYAMRVGLLTRFWGTLGIALSVSVLFLGTVIGILVFVVALGLMIGGLWPRGRPPAWDAGVAVPWPRAGREPPEPPPEEEVGLPEGFGAEPGEAEPAETAAGNGDGSRRKRKRRR